MPGGLYRDATDHFSSRMLLTWLLAPPSVIASWPKPNYIDPVTQGSALAYVCIIFSSLSLVVVTARMYSRIFITKAPGADDLLVAVAGALSIGLSALIIIQEKTWMVGHHIWDIPVDKFARQRENIYVCEWCYLIATTSVKISILLFYRRLSVTFSKTFLIATWVGILFNVLYSVTFMVLLLALFRPLESYWLSFDPMWAATHRYSHVNESGSLPASAALSVIGDFYSTLLPLLLIRFLNLPQRQKAALYSLFGLGFLVVAAGIIRTILIDRVMTKTYDVTWVLWQSWIWTVIELNVAILAASAPALKPYFRRFLVDRITSSPTQDISALDSCRRPSTGKVRSDQRFGRSKSATTARDSKMLVDMEKMGIALTKPQSKSGMIEEEIDDGMSTRRYQLRASRDGKLVPVQIHEEGFDAQSLHTSNSSDYILPSKTSDLDISAELRQYRAQVSTSSPTASRRQQRPRDTAWPPTRTDDIQQTFGPLASNPRLPSDWSRSTPGSVKAVQERAQYLQHLEQGRRHSRAISRGSERNFSLPKTTVTGSDPFQHNERDVNDTYLEDGSSSDDTLALPRQGSRRNGHKVSGVGYAI